MVNLIPYVQVDYIDTIVNAIINTAKSCVSDEEIYMSISHYLEYRTGSISQKYEMMMALSNHFVPARMVYEAKALFSYKHYWSNDENISMAQNDCVQDIFENGGINKLYDFLQGVQAKEVFINAAYRTLDIDKYYELIDEVSLKGDRYSKQLFISVMTVEETIKYCCSNSLNKIDFETLSFHAVDDQLVSFVLKNDEAHAYWKNTWVTGVNTLSKDNSDMFFEKTLTAGNISAALMFVIATKEYGAGFERVFKVLEQYEIPEENINKDKNKYQIQELIRVLQTKAFNQKERIVGVEKKFLMYLLPYQHGSPIYIYYKMANDPKYVFDMLKYNKSMSAKGIFDTNIYYLKYHFNIAIGSCEDGGFEYKSLIEWYNYTCEVEDDGIRDEMKGLIGKSLFHMEPDEDGFIVNRKIAEFIENYADEDMMREFHIEAINSHGSVNIGPDSHEEENLIDELLYKADECEKEGYIVLANAYRDIADSWKH